MRRYRRSSRSDETERGEEEKRRREKEKKEERSRARIRRDTARHGAARHARRCMYVQEEEETRRHVLMSSYPPFLKLCLLHSMIVGRVSVFYRLLSISVCC